VHRLLHHRFGEDVFLGGVEPLIESFGGFYTFAAEFSEISRAILDGDQPLYGLKDAQATARAFQRLPRRPRLSLRSPWHSEKRAVRLRQWRKRTSRLLLEIELVNIVLGEHQRLAVDDLASVADGVFAGLARLEGGAGLDVQFPS
jgi:hypothetical protein